MDEKRPSVSELAPMSPLAVMAWLPEASLDELREAMGAHIKSDVKAAILSEIRARESARDLRVATIVSVALLVVAILTLFATV